MSDLVVDAHAHLVPVGLIERTVAHPPAGVSVRDHGEGRYSFAIEGAEPTRILPFPLIDMEGRLGWMDQQGIEVQVVGTWADLFGYTLPQGKGAEWARYLNETLLEAVSVTSRFAAFASLPMQNPGAAAVMVADAIEQGFVGVTVAARIGDTELDDPKLADFWQALDDSGATVFIHPGYVPDDPRTADYGMVNAVARPVDTTIAVSRLLGAGVPERYPRAKILLAHGGGTVSFILGRLQRNRQIDPSLPDPGEGLSQLYYDSVVFDPDALCHLATKVGSSRVLLGSDYPFPMGDHQPLRVVESAPCLTDAEQGAVLGINAAALLGISR